MKLSDETHGETNTDLDSQCEHEEREVEEYHLNTFKWEVINTLIPTSTLKMLPFYSGTIFKCEYWTCDFAHVLLQKEEYHKINETYKYADSTESIKCPDCESYFYLDEAFAMHVRKIINIHILVIIVRDISLVMTICSRQAMPSSM